MHVLHFFLVILRSEKEKEGYFSFQETLNPLSFLHHKKQGGTEKEFINTLKINCSYGIFN